MKNIIVFLLLIIVIGGVLYFFSKNYSNNSPATNQITPISSRKKEDVNWDEVVNQTDVNIVQTQSGCKKSDACWNKVIGKTVTGDNPIYAFDLDINNDGVIDQKDVELIK